MRFENPTAPIKRGFFILLILLAAITACATTNAISGAENAIESARAGHADYLCPYEFTSAEIYMKEAKAQADRSDFDRAKRYAETAVEIAVSAASQAKTRVRFSAPDASFPAMKTDAPTTPATQDQNSESLDRQLFQLRSDFESLNQKQAFLCAPREFAAVGAMIEFAEEDLAQKQYLHSSDRLAAARADLLHIREFIGQCVTNDEGTANARP